MAVVPYYMDEHVTIYHGDCREVLPEFDTGSVDLVVTDPPYGIEFRSNMRTATPKFDAIEGDAELNFEWLPDVGRVLDAFGALYMFTRWDVAHDWEDAVRANTHLTIRNRIIWWKRGGGMGDLKGAWAPEHEQIIFASHAGHELRGHRYGDVWMIDKDPPGSYEHPTQKPVGVMGKAIDGSSDPGGLVLDPFTGSGSTLRAAKNHGRRSVGIEVREDYCEVAVRRLMQEAFPW